MNAKHILFFTTTILYFMVYTYFNLKLIDTFVKPKLKSIKNKTFAILISLLSMYGSHLIIFIYSILSSFNIIVLFRSYPIVSKLFNDKAIELVIDSFSNFYASSGLYNTMNISALNIGYSY